MGLKKRSGFWKRGDRLAVLAGYLILAFMLTCLVVSLVQVGQIALPQMNGAYLTGLGFLVTSAAIISRQRMHNIIFPEMEWWVYLGSELLVIMLAVKLAYYLQNGVGRLISEIPLWRVDFVKNFFSVEYVFGLLTMFLVWALSRQISSDLAMMDRDESILRQEVEAGIYEDMEEIRERLLGTLLTIGIGMIILAALLRSDPVTNWAGIPAMQASVVNLLVYFFLALVLLSLTQFSILRANWMRQRLKISRQVARQWLLYSVILIVGLAIAARLLPTGYSIGPLEILNYLFYLLILILNLIGILLITPFIYILTLLLNLFKANTISEPAPPVHMPAPPAAMHTPDVSWWLLLKSIILWVGLFAIVGYSIYYYVHERQDLLQYLHKVPFYSLLDRFLGWVAGLLNQLQGRVNSSVQAGLKRIQALRSRGLKQIRPGYLSLRHLSAREKILFYYLAMVRRGGEVGISRKPSQTPFEYSRNLSLKLEREEGPGLGEDVQVLTDEFMEARYSLHQVADDQVGLVQKCWARIRKAFKRPV